MDTKDERQLESFSLSKNAIDAYLESKRQQGVSEKSLRCYAKALKKLHGWLPDNKRLTAPLLQNYRAGLDEYGYSKNTIQSFVKYINDFLRYAGYEQMCIPKPMRHDLCGRVFGYLTVIEPADSRSKKGILWKCQCRCGREIEVITTALTTGKTTSCGCLNMEILQHRNRYEEGTELRQSMEERIRNPHSASGYVGVQPKRNKWAAYITYKKKHYFLGSFDDIEDAIKARARAKEAIMEDADRIYQETDHRYGESPRRPPRPPRAAIPVPEPVEIPVRRSDNTSGHTGITRQYEKWNASISYAGRRYRLGAYENLEEAIAVRKQAEKLVAQHDLEGLLKLATGPGTLNNPKKA